MRFYAFANHVYLSPIQCGIQAGHCQGEMQVKYTKDWSVKTEPSKYLPQDEWSPQASMFMEFLEKHKTWYVMAGGDQKSLCDLHDFFDKAEIEGLNMFPFGWFHEEVSALNGALTCVGIVLPARIYETMDLLKKDKTGEFRRHIEEQFSRRGHAVIDWENPAPELQLDNHWEFELAELLSTYRFV